MAICYGHRWTSNYGSAIDENNKLTDAGSIWLNGLIDLSTDQIKNGLDEMLKAGNEWPPSMPQFVKMCKSEPEAWQHKTAAYREYTPKARQLTHKCNPEVAENSLAEMKKKLGMKSESN